MCLIRISGRRILGLVGRRSKGRTRGRGSCSVKQRKHVGCALCCYSPTNPDTTLLTPRSRSLESLGSPGQEEEGHSHSLRPFLCSTNQSCSSPSARSCIYFGHHARRRWFPRPSREKEEEEGAGSGLLGAAEGELEEECRGVQEDYRGTVEG